MPNYEDNAREAQAAAYLPIKLTNDSIVQGVLLATVRLYGAPQMKRSRKYHTQAAKVSIP